MLAMRVYGEEFKVQLSSTTTDSVHVEKDKLKETDSV